MIEEIIKRKLLSETKSIKSVSVSLEKHELWSHHRDTVMKIAVLRGYTRQSQ